MAKKKSKEKLKNTKGLKMKLHEAIERILIEKDKQLTGKQIAELINEQRLYERSDGKPVQSNQIIARINNYPAIFYKQDKFIGLKKWGDEKKYKKSLLAKEIEFILQLHYKADEESVPIKILTDTINKRNDYERKFEKDFTEEEILNEIKNNSQIFKLNNENVELIKEANEYIKYKTKLNLVDSLVKYTKIKGKELKNSVKSISVTNFKSYNLMQKLELKPITLLFGPNSSGKSSLLHSILYLQNAFDSKDLDPTYMRISGDSVDLGGFKQLIYKHDFNRKLKYKLELDKTKFSETLNNYFKKNNEINVNIEISQPLKPKKRKQIVKADGKGVWTNEVAVNEFIPSGKPRIERYEIILDSEIMLSFGYIDSDVKYENLKLNSLNYSNEIIQNINKKLLADYLRTSPAKKINLNILEDYLDNVIDYFYVPDKEIIPRKIEVYDKRTIGVINDNSTLTELEDFILEHFPTIINKIIEELFESIEFSLKKLVYLGPMRSYPTRDFHSVNINDPNYFAGGAFAWNKLLENEEDRKKVNEWLNKLDINYKIKVGKSSEQLYNKFLEVGEKLDFDLSVLGEAYYADEIAKIIEEKINETAIDDELKLALVDKANIAVSPRDVGFGISQIIPVLVSTLANKNKIILIEQPEIHLHPALQAELGDVMIESALGENKNTLILENHSEHMILRILRRIRETSNGKLPKGLTPIKPEDVAVIYIQNTEEGSKLNYIPIDEKGRFTKKWPNGFFEERINEIR